MRWASHISVRLLRSVVLLAGVWYLLAYLYIVIRRIRYPFSLEWMEGSAIAHLDRILAGLPLYHEPSLEHLPNMYTPLYYYLSAAVAAVSSPGLVSLRVVSFVSSMGILALVFWIIRRETRSTFPAILGACIFIATFRITGAWLDLARVDSLFLFLMLASFYQLRFGEGGKSAAAAGVLAGLSFLTKQAAAIIGLPMGLLLLAISFRRGVWYCVGVGGVVGLATLVLHFTTGGWFLYYITLAGEHTLRQRFWIDFWTDDLIKPLHFVVLLALIGHVFFRSRGERSWMLYLAAGVGFIGGTWYMRLLPLAYNNVLLPAYLWLALMAGLGLHYLMKQARDRGSNRLYLVVLATLLVQLCMLRYDVGAQLPKRRDTIAGLRLVQRIQGMKGRLFIPSHDYLLARAGKRGHAHMMPIWETLASHPSPGRARLIKQLQDAVAQQRFSAVILDEHNFIAKKVHAIVKAHYQRKEELFPRSGAFIPVTGLRSRPRAIYLPKKKKPAKKKK